MVEKNQNIKEGCLDYYFVQKKLKFRIMDNGKYFIVQRKGFFEWITIMRSQHCANWDTGHYSKEFNSRDEAVSFIKKFYGENAHLDQENFVVSVR